MFHLLVLESINKFLIKDSWKRAGLAARKLWLEPPSLCRSKEQYSVSACHQPQMHEPKAACLACSADCTYDADGAGSQQYTYPVASHMYGICCTLAYFSTLYIQKRCIEL